MPKIIKKIWLVYAVFSVLFGLFSLTQHGDMFAWSLLLMLPHLGLFMWYSFKA